MVGFKLYIYTFPLFFDCGIIACLCLIENRELLQEGKRLLKISKRKDYYKILGVTRTATDDEIKKACKKKALVYHSSRHSGGSEEDRKEAETNFKEIGEAYSVLSDKRKRTRYDNGQDLEEMGGMGGNVL